MTVLGSEVPISSLSECNSVIESRSTAASKYDQKILESLCLELDSAQRRFLPVLRPGKTANPFWNSKSEPPSSGWCGDR